MRESAKYLSEILNEMVIEHRVVAIDYTKVDDDHKQLADRLGELGECINTMDSYTKALSQGNIEDVHFPSENNSLCRNLKDLHTNLQHLIWQAREVADGDYTQHISYLGDFAKSFNTMVEKLKERDELMQAAADEARRRAVEAQSKALLMQSYNSLLVEVTQNRREWIFVIDSKTREIYYCNKIDLSIKNLGEDMHSMCSECLHKLDIHDVVMNHVPERGDETWELQNDKKTRWYQVHSFTIEWQGALAYANIISDITRVKTESEQLSIIAFRDPLTQLYNRRYMEDTIDRLLKAHEKFTFVFIDLDGLKYVNDNFGHGEGDNFIKFSSVLITKAVRDNDIVGRIGGDEFGIILMDCPVEIAQEKLAVAYSRFREQFDEDKNPYHGFSYGCTYVDGTVDLTTREVIAAADREMYACKKSHKHLYNDGRQQVVV
jgi:diguanylate cyclase (GGDEF)-like protein